MFKEFNTNIDKKIFQQRRFVISFGKKNYIWDKTSIDSLSFNIAKADGSISKAEIEKLLEFTQLLNISRVDFESIKAMFFKSSDSRLQKF